MNPSPVNRPLAVLPRKADSQKALRHRILQCGSIELSLARPAVMAVLNVTPDSFSDGGVLPAMDRGELREHAQSLIDAGARLLDIGGESTRPGAQGISEAEECRRVMPVLELLLDLDVVISVDTSKPGVAQRALALGCHMINDVSGLRDPEMLKTIAGSRAAVVIMHMLGAPRTMQDDPQYEDVVAEVSGYFGTQVAACQAAGINLERVCVDPGFGFGKTLTHNLTLLRDLAVFQNLGVAVMAGLSRKSMIGAITGREVSERLSGSVAAALLAAQAGADIVRVHDVAATVDAMKILTALRELPDR
jgi:dihydropteroate synthase